MTLSFRPSFGWALVAALCVAFVSFFLSLQIGCFLLIFIILGWWAASHPHAALSLLVLIAPLLPMFKVTNTIGTITLLKDVIIFVLFAVFFVVPLVQQRLPYRRNPLFIPLFLLTAWTAVEILLAESLTLGVLRARDIVLYMLLYIAVLYVPYRKGFLKELLTWFFISASVAMLLGVYQWYFALDSAVLRFDPGRNIWIPRVSSTFAHPSVFGQYLVTVVTLFGALLLSNSQRWLKGFISLLGLGLTVLVYLTYSRAVWIGFLVGLAAIALVYGMRRMQTRTSWLTKKAFVGIGLGIVVVGIVLFQFTSANIFIRSIFDPTYKSNEARLEFLARLIAPTTNTQAIIGQGLGNVLRQNFREIELEGIDIAAGDSRTIQLSKDATLVDNQYLKTFIEMGLVGLLLYAWIYIIIGKQALEQTKSMYSNTQRLVALWTVGFLTSFIVQALFIDIWEIFPTNLAFWIIAGILFRSATYTEKNHE